jgi:hypothetical protein
MATVDPNKRKVTVAYEKGTATMSYGLLKAIFPAAELRWEPISNAQNPFTGRKSFKYGRRQRSLAAGGTSVSVMIEDGSVWTIRIAGHISNFIDQVLARTPDNTVLSMWTERGTIYGPQFVDLINQT